MNGELEQRLLRLASEVHAPAAALSALERAQASVSAPRARDVRLPWIGVRVAASAVVGAILLAVVASTLAPTNARASEILAQAERAALTGTSALQSYRGTIQGQKFATAQDRSSATYEQQIAFTAPGKMRLDVTVTGPDGAVGKQLLVSDGTNAWIYVAEAKVAQPIEPQFVLQNGPFAASTLGAALESFAKVFDAKQLADEQVAGRAAYVLELTPKLPEMAKQVGKITMWLDRETLLQLAAEMRDPSGAPLMRWRFASVSLNVDIAADTFVLVLPPGTKVGQILPPGAQTPQRDAAWKQLAASVPFQLFRPFCGIDGLTEGVPGKNENGVVVLPFQVPNGPAVVALLQGPASAFPATGGGEAITIGELKATYRVADGVQSLDFDRDGTHVRIQAPQPFPKEALVHLAVSFTPVPRS